MIQIFLTYPVSILEFNPINEQSLLHVMVEWSEIVILLSTIVQLYNSIHIYPDKSVLIVGETSVTEVYGI